MLRRFLSTDNDMSSLVLRVMLGGVFLPHGMQKVFGWFGGHGLAGTLHHFTENMGIPFVLALLVIAAESLGALGLIAGLLTRLAAFGLGCVMLGAIFMVHLPHGFFMNWFGRQQGEGFEYHLLAVAIAVALVIKGGGALSLDRSLASKLE
ncbi:MAG: hypothetical protein C0617_09455 [Desulfuromonas sp.]|uniref:DoxX family protein n=1 Tax=Desulfuromonas sp. TaxID=892 RepID=UPI000CB845C6|nr:DoxX family protein [Desulfuromonas sp.]PLX84038.1 MAG: hypothetical protein C0617_09455 [Desulfuromonas sp.]